MKFKLTLTIICICLCSCNKDKLLSKVEMEIEKYSECVDYHSFESWFNQDDYEIEDDDKAVYCLIKTTPDARTDEVYINLKLLSGVAEYHKDDFLIQKVEEFKEYFKNNDYVLDITTDIGYIQVLLRNEQQFHYDDKMGG